jgi:predicted NUDIX family NTP pyrophosphohydrolase
LPSHLAKSRANREFDNLWSCARHGIALADRARKAARGDQHILRDALQEIADGQADVDGYIALVPEEERSRPDVGAEIGRRPLAAGRTTEAVAALESAKPKQRVRRAMEHDLDELDVAGYGDGGSWENTYIEALDASWSIPKGIVGPVEDALIAARRAFKEETGFEVDGTFKLLGTFRQPGGKLVTAYAVEGDCDAAALVSNTFSMEWSPRSAKLQFFPEADRGAWFDRTEAEIKILKGQRAILDKLDQHSH